MPIEGDFTARHRILSRSMAVTHFKATAIVAVFATRPIPAFLGNNVEESEQHTGKIVEWVIFLSTASVAVIVRVRITNGAGSSNVTFSCGAFLAPLAVHGVPSPHPPARLAPLDARGRRRFDLAGRTPSDVARRRARWRGAGIVARR